MEVIRIEHGISTSYTCPQCNGYTIPISIVKEDTSIIYDVCIRCWHKLDVPEKGEIEVVTDETIYGLD